MFIFAVQNRIINPPGNEHKTTKTMKTTDKNTAKKAVNELKASIKADFLECIELVNFGIQVYNVIDGDEYSVITKAEKTNGRYYFITREGQRVAWSTIPAEKLETACDHFLAQMKADETTERTGECTTEKHNVTAARVAYISSIIADAAGIVSGSILPQSDMKISIEQFYDWQKHDDEPFFMAVRDHGTEAGTRQHCRERCKKLGAPVYVIAIKREYNREGNAMCGRFAMRIRSRK